MDYSTRPKRLSCNYSYIQTKPGMFKGIELICGAIAIILGAAGLSSDDDVGQKRFFTIVAALAFTVTAVTLLLAMINLQNICIPAKWPLIEVIISGTIIVLFIIASILAAVVADSHKIYGAAAFFGFVASVIYGVDLVLRLWKMGVFPCRRRRPPSVPGPAYVGDPSVNTTQPAV